MSLYNFWSGLVLTEPHNQHCLRSKDEHKPFKPEYASLYAILGDLGERSGLPVFDNMDYRISSMYSELPTS